MLADVRCDATVYDRTSLIQLNIYAYSCIYLSKNASFSIESSNIDIILSDSMLINLSMITICYKLSNYTVLSESVLYVDDTESITNTDYSLCV